MALVAVYMSLGDFNLAWTEMDTILTSEQSDRGMIDHYKIVPCYIPSTFINVMDGKRKFAPNTFTSGDAKYVLLMIHMTRHASCIGEPEVKISSELLALMQERLSHTTSYQKGEEETANNDILTISERALCKDSEVQVYLLEKKYLIHPCSREEESEEKYGSESDNDYADISTTTATTTVKACSIFRDPLPPAYEDFQVSTASQSFIGAAIPTDIIHHVYSGDMRKIFSDDVTFKALFAEYFSPDMVLSLLGNFETLAFKNYEITIVTPLEDIMTQIDETYMKCALTYTSSEKKKVKYFIQSLDEFGATFRSSSGMRFDYVEYSGGLSKSSSYMQHLKILQSLLTPKGAHYVMYVCMYVCMNTCMNMRRNVCMYHSMFVNIAVCMCIQLYIYVYSILCIGLYPMACIFVCMYVCMYV